MQLSFILSMAQSSALSAIAIAIQQRIASYQLAIGIVPRPMRYRSINRRTSYNIQIVLKKVGVIVTIRPSLSPTIIDIKPRVSLSISFIPLF